MYIKLEDLKKIFKKENLPHAVLFEGASAEERFEAAVFLAKIISCNEEVTPCEKCVSCVKIEKNIHPDIKIISKGEFASIKIEQVRDLRTEVHIIPNESSHKVFIIEEANLMTVQAQNAFIKILEEPPKNVIFILICGSASSLLETIRSRVQTYTLQGKLTEDENNEILEIAKKLADTSKNDSKLGVLEYLSKIPNNRPFLKNVLENLVRILIKNYEPKKNILEKIESVKYILSLVDRNINFNMMISFLCVCL